MSDYWAKAPQPREQIVLFPTTIDSMIPPDHQVRLFAEVLDLCDWSAWEARYHGRVGQPPLHPKVLAGLLLYGLRNQVRSSRRLEHAASHSLDFIWLLEGRRPDHSTICEFRTKFDGELRDLFRQVIRIAWHAGALNLTEVGFDGTRVKANNGRYETWTAEKVELEIGRLTKEFETSLAEMAQNDTEATTAPTQLPPHLANLKERRELLKQIREKCCDADNNRRKEGIDPKRNPAQIPKTDPDARVMANKEGGYAVNYNPVVATESLSGYILDADVLNTQNENHELVPSVGRIEAAFQQKPERILADGAFSTGENIVALEQLGIELYSPLSLPEPKSNPAMRDDPTQPVPEAAWSQLPMSPQIKRLDKSCFVYDPKQDVYFCPMGRSLPFDERKTDRQHGRKLVLMLYRCESCEGCPLASRCITDRSTSGVRSITRDAYTDDRERHAKRMRSDQAKAIYKKRMQTAETPFAFIKQILGLRQFLLRGLDKVKMEWRWACLTSNVSKLGRHLRGKNVVAKPRAAKTD